MKVWLYLAKATPATLGGNPQGRKGFFPAGNIMLIFHREFLLKHLQTDSILDYDFSLVTLFYLIQIIFL